MDTKKSSGYQGNQPIGAAWELDAFNGIKGFPPKWVPEPRVKEFLTERGVLFVEVEQGKATYDEIQSRFDWFKNEKEEADIRRALFPGERRDYDGCLSYLVWLFEAVSLGPEEGLSRLAGIDAVNGFLSREGYTKRDKHLAKLDFQEQAKQLFETNGYNITATIKEPALAEYARKHYGKHTLRDWLKEIRPTGKMQKGRPKKT